MTAYLTGPDGEPVRLLTRSEVADLFRVTAPTVTRWAQQGRIAAIRTPGGRDPRYRETEVRALLNGEQR